MEKNVALYARVSTERQEQVGTIESQVAELESYAQEQGYEIDEALIFLDQAVSGASLARPALDQLRDLAYEGEIDMLLCLSPDRLARQYVHQCLLLEEFQRWGVTVQFIQQPDLADTPQNRLLLGVQGLFAEYERAVMRERMRRGRLHRIRQGGRCFHPAPFGYRYIPVKEAHGGRWEIDTQEAAVVRQIFAWYTEECWSLKKIARQLNETGVPVRRKGGRWGAGRISVILDQPAYAGKAYYNRYRTRPESVGRRKKQGRGRLVAPDKVLRPRDEWIEVDTPAILSQEIWQQAQDQRMHNKRFSQRNNHKQFYLLRGLLVCGVGFPWRNAPDMPMHPQGGWRWGDRYESNGERIYFTATNQEGEWITYTAGPAFGRGMMGSSLTCASCHGDDGRGGTHFMHMQVMDAPDIRFRVLSEEEDEHGGEDHAASEHDHEGEGYDLKAFHSAVVEGEHPNGEPLEHDMPRWEISDHDLADLFEFIKTLD